jgi:ABC-2 type transport system permease protein
MSSTARIGAIAQREYRQIVRTRAFLISLLGLPLIIALVAAISIRLQPPQGEAFAIFDRSGAEGGIIEQAIEIDYQRSVMTRLAAYGEGRDAAAKAAGEAWAGGLRWFSDAEVMDFMAKGGAEAAVRTLSPGKADEAPFKGQDRRFLRTTKQTSLAPDAGPEAFHSAYRPSPKAMAPTAVGPRPLSLAIYVPAGFSRGEPVRMWTNGKANPVLINLVQAELTRARRGQIAIEAGIDPAAIARINAVTAPSLIMAPPRSESTRLALKSAIPAFLAYLLMMTVIITGSMMLQGVIEERSNKLLESVLACVTPNELMLGKLFGICAVGLTVVIGWGVFVAVGFHLAPASATAPMRDMMGTLDSPLLLAAAIFYYLAGYFTISMLFLAVGVLSDSMQDAQGYLTPLMLLIIMPFALVLPQAIAGGSGTALVVLSWIPLYTPFAMLSRLGLGVSPVEVIGTGVLLLAFLGAELFLIGRLFRASLLRTGQPPKLAAIIKLMGKPAPA